jgi:hypothetical protein
MKSPKTQAQHRHFGASDPSCLMIPQGSDDVGNRDTYYPPGMACHGRRSPAARSARHALER